MDVCFVIQQRLKELGLEQRDLAVAAQVTESYISQLLTRKKAPPSAERTDLYDKMNAFLKLPPGQLSAMAQEQQREELKKKVADLPAPLFKNVRELIIRKCAAQKQRQMRDIFEKQAFGELERLITLRLVDVAKGVAKDELNNEGWLRTVAKLSGRSYEEMRAITLEFLDTDVFSVSPEHCSAFLDPMIDFWDIDLETFAMEIVLNRRLASRQVMKFQFVQTDSAPSSEEQPGFKEFLNSSAMSGGATGEELEFLASLRFGEGRPTPLYYYRELQSLRDPLHFRENPSAPMRKRGEASEAERRSQVESRKSAVRRWAKNKGRSRKNGKPKIA
ncbi:MAG TPA: helix-turn-helix transcriptional regulator [Candidatus Acidoferrum sp.]